MRTACFALVMGALVTVAPSARGDDPSAPPPPPQPPPTTQDWLPRFGPFSPAGTPRDQASDGLGTLGSWASRPRGILLQGGSAGGPLGYGGLSFEYAPLPWLVAGAGAGFNGAGATAAFMPRLRLPLTRWLAIGFGVPFSAGPYVAVLTQPELCSPGCQAGFRTTRTWDVAFWLHAEPNIEMRVPRLPGMAMRFYGGESFLLNTHDDRCDSTLSGGCPSSIGERIWYGGIALGYAW